jgi:predicted flap endonuclease-1-like 5' DNA nuclease
MIEMIEANWLLFVIALLIGIAVAWFVFAGTRRTRVDIDRRDTLDEGAAPAARNQALIDAAPAARSEPVPIPPETPMGLAGVGTAVAAAVEEAELEAEEASRDRPPVTQGEGDDLTRIKGLGPKLAQTLNALGVARFEQIAGWSESDIERIDAQLGRFQGRIRRDGWVEQAGYLARGDIEGFKARFGAI